MSQSSEFCRHKPLCCFSKSAYCWCLFRHRSSPGTFGYTLVLPSCYIPCSVKFATHYARRITSTSLYTVKVWCMGTETTLPLTGWMIGGSIPNRGWEISLLHGIQTGSYVQPASCPMGTGGFFLGVNRPRHQADHSPLSSAEVNKAWCYTSSPIRLHGVVLSSAQGQL